MDRRCLLAAAPGLLLAGAALARAPRGLWFDPTQLPSYSGRLERWLMNPAGEIDRALLREGVQVIFPASEAEALMAAVTVDANFTAYGIRARNAPVVMMLAWAKSDTDTASFVSSPAWFASESRGREELSVQGRVQAPLLTPQGQGMGVILEDGNVIRVPVEVHDALGDRVKVGETIAAGGLGTRRENRLALDAVRVGRTPERLEPLPTPAPERRP